MDSRVVQQPLDVRIRAVAGHKVLDEMQEQFTSDRLVAVDVSDVLDVGLAQHVLVRRGGDLVGRFKLGLELFLLH